MLSNVDVVLSQDLPVQEEKEFLRLIPTLIDNLTFEVELNGKIADKVAASLILDMQLREEVGLGHISHILLVGIAQIGCQSLLDFLID